VPSQRFHHRDTWRHRIAAVLANQHQPLYRDFPLRQFALDYRQLDDVRGGVAHRDQRIPALQHDRLKKLLFP